MKLADNFKKVREEISKEGGSLGIGLGEPGSRLSTIVGGARLGKFYTYSAPTGEGKTRFLVSNACSISVPRVGRLQDLKHSWKKVLYICTEQTETEIGMMILAYRSGIPQSRLRKGMSKLTKEEIEKIDEACRLAEAYTDNFETIAVEDPSADTIEKLIRKYIKSEDIQYVFFDYIFTSPSILQQFGGRNIREDTVLRMFSTKLKQIAVDNNIFIRSATQLNDGWSKNIVGERNQNCRRGAKAIADKIDVGLIGIKARQEELNRVQSLIKGRTPNQVIDVYKNRDGEYTNIKLFRYFDYGTCQGVDLFATNDNYELIEIKE